MFRDRYAYKYFRLAVDEPNMELAKEFFAVARRCQELADKNRSLIKLADRASYLLEDMGRLSFPIRARPNCWNEDFQTGFPSGLRLNAVRVRSFESRRQLERSADDIETLEGRNRLIREKLDRLVDQNRDDQQWVDWIAAYKAEKERQGECFCCGMGCHTCDRCRVDRNKPSPFLRYQNEEGTIAVAQVV